MYNDTIITNGLNVVIGFDPKNHIRDRRNMNEFYNEFCKNFVNLIFDNPGLRDCKISYTNIDELNCDNIDDICLLLNHNLETTNPDINIIELGRFEYFMNFESESLDELLISLADLNRKTILICHSLDVPSQILAISKVVMENYSATEFVIDKHRYMISLNNSKFRYSIYNKDVI